MLDEFTTTLTNTDDETSNNVSWEPIYHNGRRIADRTVTSNDPMKLVLSTSTAAKVIASLYIAGSGIIGFGSVCFVLLVFPRGGVFDLSTIKTLLGASVFVGVMCIIQFSQFLKITLDKFSGQIYTGKAPAQTNILLLA